MKSFLLILLSVFCMNVHAQDSVIARPGTDTVYRFTAPYWLFLEGGDTAELQKTLYAGFGNENEVTASLRDALGFFITDASVEKMQVTGFFRCKPRSEECDQYLEILKSKTSQIVFKKIKDTQSVFFYYARAAGSSEAHWYTATFVKPPVPAKTKADITLIEKALKTEFMKKAKKHGFHLTHVADEKNPALLGVVTCEQEHKDVLACSEQVAKLSKALPKTHIDIDHDYDFPMFGLGSYRLMLYRHR